MLNLSLSICLKSSLLISIFVLPVTQYHTSILNAYLCTNFGISKYLLLLLLYLFKIFLLCCISQNNQPKYVKTAVINIPIYNPISNNINLSSLIYQFFNSTSKYFSKPTSCPDGHISSTCLSMCYH